MPLLKSTVVVAAEAAADGVVMVLMVLIQHFILSTHQLVVLVELMVVQHITNVANNHVKERVLNG